MSSNALWSRWRALLVLIGVLGACSAQRDETTLRAALGDSARADEASPGRLRLPLVTSGEDRYRLRDAAFAIASAEGEPIARLETESKPDADSLSIELAAGAYVVTLEAGWHLEHVARTSALALSAALVSPESQAFEIRRGQATEVVYVFSTLGGPLRLGSSELVVRAEVTPPPTVASCDVLDQASCPEGEACLLAGTGATLCARAGELPLGAPCNAERCVAGAQCMYLDPERPDVGVCAAFCSPAASPAGCDCRPLELDGALGVCVPGEGCGGSGCAERVLVAGAPADPSWNLDVQGKLAGTGAFAAVDVFDLARATPTLPELAEYAAVLVYSDSSFADGEALGDNLADYFDRGGRVVVAAFANATVSLGGRWASEGYGLIEPLGQEQGLESGALGVLEPGSALLSGVSSLTATAAFRSSGGLLDGGVVVATWGSGAPLVVRGLRDGRGRVELNLFPPSSDVRSDLWSGDGAELMRNALVFE